MKTVEEHFSDVLELALPTQVEHVSLAQAQGRTLGADLTARFPVPPFTNAAMDGFAVRCDDINVGHPLTVVGDTAAGDVASELAEPASAVRIMTGAPMPAGADAVVRVEDTVDAEKNMLPTAPTHVIPTSSVSRGANVRFQGEDVAVGDLVLERGTRLSPTHVSALASVGYGQVPVHKRVKVSVISTGHELRAPGEDLLPGQIPDSNSLLVAGLLRECHADVELRSIASDQNGTFSQAFDNAAADSNLVITTGGVSMGAFDVVKASLSSRGINFAPVAMQPGKPQGWGKVGKTVVLCLPGNPVSVFVSMQLFALPLVRAMQGEVVDDMYCHTEVAVAGTGWKHKIGRTQFMPARIRENQIYPASAGGSGSHLVASLPRARVLAITPANQGNVCAGDDIRFLRYSL
ncbi:molybdopterin molybdotransferase MoeA [Arcanobacterium canis]